MKKLITLACLILSFQAFASSDKVYVDSSRILINDNRIHIIDEDMDYEVSYLYTDEKGIYILSDSTQQRIEPYWICRHCGKKNSYYDYECTDRSCRFPRRD